MKKRYYLAYGSNLNINQMKMRCPSAFVVGTGYIHNYELLFKGSKTGSYLTIEKQQGKKVPVAIWQVSQDDERSLDRYEGYPMFYYKKEVKITTDNGEKRNAFVYIMNEDRPLGKPSDIYIDACVCGYKSFGFDKTYLSNAYHKSCKGMIV